MNTTIQFDTHFDPLRSTERVMRAYAGYDAHAAPFGPRLLRRHRVSIRTEAAAALRLLEDVLEREQVDAMLTVGDDHWSARYDPRPREGFVLGARLFHPRSTSIQPEAFSEGLVLLDQYARVPLVTYREGDGWRAEGYLSGAIDDLEGMTRLAAGLDETGTLESCRYSLPAGVLDFETKRS